MKKYLAFLGVGTGLVVTSILGISVLGYAQPGISGWTGIHNTSTLPTLRDGQSAAAQLDRQGRLLVSPSSSITMSTIGNSTNPVSNAYFSNVTTTNLSVLGQFSIPVGGYALGSLGINTTSPIATLAVKGSDGKNPLVIASSTGSSLLTILTNGNVGIGTASPSSKLDVPVSNGTLKFHDSTTAGGLWMIGGGLFGVGNVAYFAASGVNNLTLATGGTRDTFTYGTPRLTILASNGNIGIGTTTPLSNLVIQGFGTSSPFTVVSSTAVGSMFTILPNGNVGINSSTPIDDVAVSGSATTTFILDSTSATRGGCIAVKDSDGSGYTYITYNNGAQTVSATSCR
jgi:hypothetical protein